MSVLNFSWAILGAVLIGLVSMMSIPIMAVYGVGDMSIYAAMILITTNVLTLLGAVMNPSKTFGKQKEE